jgi:polysaccharide export outer membrane protein
MSQAKAVIDRQVSTTPARVEGNAKEPQQSGSAVLKPTDVLAWSVEMPPQSYAASASGKAAVDGDGMLQLGRYGSVKVAGLTYSEAKAVIQKHMADASKRISEEKNVSTIETRTDPTVAQVAQPGMQLLNYDSTPVPAGGIKLATATGSSTFAPDQSPAPVAAAPISDVPETRATVPPPDSGILITPRRVPAQLPADTPAPQSPRATTGEVAPMPQRLAVEAGHCAGQVPQELNKISLGPYIIEPPDVLLIESTQSLRDQPIRGQHLVRPDGTVGLGIYGSVHVAGLTLDQAQSVIAAQVGLRVKNLDAQNLYVDVLAYNSHVYYVITDGGGYGEQVFRLPITGNETVLDAIGQIAGLPAVASKRQIWLARPVPGDGHHQQIMPINWLAITQCAATDTNYQILPGDRIYVMADRWITFDSRVAKVLSPFTRMLGFTLLGAETVQTIRGRNSFGGF